MDTSSTHFLAEYFGCDPARLNDAEHLRALMLEAVEAVGATLLDIICHRFSPQGVTIVVAVSESHFSLHTWPEHGYAAVDVFTCGACDPSLAHPLLKSGLAAGAAQVLDLQRGAGAVGHAIIERRHRVEDRGGARAMPPLPTVERQGTWINEPDDGLAFSLGLECQRVLFDQQGAFQRVQVFENDRFGRVLALDGIFQTADADEAHYHEMLVHPALACVEHPRRVLVIGGGDGGTAREVLRHPGVEQCVMVEIDPMVVDACQRFMPQVGRGVWEDPRLDLRIADAVKFVQQAADASFDAIIVDSSDPVGPNEGLFGVTFLRDCRRLLRAGGVFGRQTGTFLFDTGASDFYRHQVALRSIFAEVHPYSAPLALYGCGHWTWTMASAERAPADAERARGAALAESGEVYDDVLHDSLFVLPLGVRRRLAVLGRPESARSGAA